MPLLHPPWPLLDLPAEEIRPPPPRQVKLHFPRLCKHRRHQQALTKHELPVQEPRRRVIRELETHSAQTQRQSRRDAPRRLRRDIRHQPRLQGHEGAQDRRAPLVATVVVVDRPRHAVRVRAVQSAVAAE